MVPDDLSPTKQEIKFAMQAHGERRQTQSKHNANPLAYGSPYGMMSSNITHFQDDSFPHHHSGEQTFSGMHYGHEQPLEDYHLQYDQTSSTYHQQHDQHAQTDQGFHVPSHGQDYFDQHIPADAQSWLGTPRSAYGQQSLELTPRHPPSRAPQPFHAPGLRQPPSLLSEPYDTKKEMRKFLDEQAESIKENKGKTVMYNPERQGESSKASNTTVDRSNVMDRGSSEAERSPSKFPANWQVMPPPAVPLSMGQAVNKPPPGLPLPEALENALKKPAPGLPFPTNFGLADFSSTTHGEDGANEEGDEQLKKLHNSSWTHLRPSKEERDRTRRCMARAAKSLAPTVAPDRMFNEPFGARDSINNAWIGMDNRGENEIRDRVEPLALEYATKKYASQSVLKVGVDDGMASNFLLGHVAANLQTYMAGDNKSVEQRRNFHKVKSVPDWCTEKSPDAHTSYLGPGWGIPPTRVSRDPRFRPGKEGQKIKPADEWKNRHEMYGRRTK